MYIHESDHPLVGMQVEWNGYPATVIGTGSVDYIWIANRLGHAELVPTLQFPELHKQICKPPKKVS